MSEANVERSRRMWSRFLTDDLPGTLAFLDPEIKVHDLPGLPDARVYAGHDGYLEQIANFQEAFSRLSYEPVEFIGIGDKVVSVIRAKGTAATGGIEGETTYAQLETWRGGKVVEIRYFLSKADALEAAESPE